MEVAGESSGDEASDPVLSDEAAKSKSEAATKKHENPKDEASKSMEKGAAKVEKECLKDEMIHPEVCGLHFS